MLGSYNRTARTIAVVLSICLSASSCGTQQVQATTVHVQATSLNAEHDEVISANGVAYYYPNRTNPRELVFRGQNGGLLGATCIDQGCSGLNLTISGSTKGLDGKYQLLKTDDPNLMMLRDSTGERIIGYLAQNGSEAKFFPDLAQAQAFEHSGETTRQVVKVVGVALLITALVAAAGAVAVANAKANTVTTRCTTFGSTTTCKSN